MLRGPALDGLLIGVTIFVILVLTARIWGPWIGRHLTTIRMDLNHTGEVVFRRLSRIFGQGATRPQGKDRHR